MREKENKMGVLGINKLLITMALPMMASMLVQALYNIVDSMYVSQISEDAFTAVSLAFPIQQLMIALASGIGVGVNALLSKSLGEKNFEKANASATNGIFLHILGAILFLIIGLTIIDPFYRSQTTDPEILQAGHEYLTVICCYSIGLFTQMISEKLLQSTGLTMYSMIVQGVGAVINIILDPILIFGWWIFPEMGVTGAAVATVVGQMIGAVLGIIINIKKNHDIHIKFKGFKPDMEIIRTIFAVGVPSIIMQSVGSVLNYSMNLILMTFGSTAAAVFGAYYKLQSFIFMPVFGLTNATIPIVAYNYGAGSKERVMKTIKSSIFAAVAIMFVGMLAFQFVPAPLLSIFNASEHMLALGIPALRIISIAFVPAGYSIVMSSVYQSLGNGVYSMITSLARQIGVLLPAAYLLAQLGNVDLVWLSFPIAEVVSLILTTVFFVKIYKKIIVKIGQ